MLCCAMLWKVALRQPPADGPDALLTSRLRGTGPWGLSGSAGGGSAFALQKLWILTGGWTVSTKGHGRWRAERGAVQVETCRESLTLTPELAGPVWRLVTGLA